MNKKDLHSGMKLETKSGRQYILIKDTDSGDILLRNQQDWNYLAFYEDNLIYLYDRSYDIIKIFKYVGHLADMLFRNDKDFQLVWERPELSFENSCECRSSGNIEFSDELIEKLSEKVLENISKYKYTVIKN